MASFDSAVKFMVAIHNEEICKLQAQIADLHGCGNAAHSHDCWSVPNSEGNHNLPHFQNKYNKLKPSTPRGPTAPDNPMVLQPRHEPCQHGLARPSLRPDDEHVRPSTPKKERLIRDGNAEPWRQTEFPPTLIKAVIGFQDEITCQLQHYRADLVAELQALREGMVKCGGGCQLPDASGTVMAELSNDGSEHSDTRPAVRLTCIKRYWERSHQHNEVLRCASSAAAAERARLVADSRRNKWSRLFMLFQAIPPLTIMMNAITIGVSADVEPESPFWKICEAIFILVYTVEFVVHTWTLGCRQYFCGRERNWNWFDFMCVLVSLVDLTMVYVISLKESSTKFVGLMKVLRLARLARLVRALHWGIFVELKQMVLGVIEGVRVLMWAIVLLLVCIFFLGVSTNLMISHEEGFTSVPIAMFTVFRCFTDGCSAYDGTPLGARLFRKYGVPVLFIYVSTFMLLSVGIFNLIMAIFIDHFVRRNLTRRLQDLGINKESNQLTIKETVADLAHKSHPEWAHFAGAPTISNVLQYALSPLRPRASSCDGAEQMEQPASRPDLAKAFSKMALDEHVEVKRETFQKWLETDELHTMLKNVDIETADKTELFDVLDVDMEGSLSMDELVTGLMKLRGPITKSDIVAVQLKVRYMTSIMEDIWHKVMGV